MSHAVSIATVCAGVVALIPVIAIEHDLAEEVHDDIVTNSRGHSQFATARCEFPELAIPLYIDAEEVMVSGTTRGAVKQPETVSKAVDEYFAELRSQVEDMWSQDPEWKTKKFNDRSLSLIVDRSASLDTVIAVARGLDAQGLRKLQLVSFQPRPERLWALDAQHLHPCSVRVELGEDGVPMSSFASWRDLVAAIDASPTPLKLSAR